MVDRNPCGVTMKQLMSELEHHYSSIASARCAIPKWINQGLVPGVKIDYEKGKIILRSGDVAKRKSDCSD
jgi:hypothetical protein